MLKKLEIHGIHKINDKKLYKYVTKKIGNLDRYMSKKYHDSAHIEIYLKEHKQKDNNHCSFSATLHLPKQTIVIKEKSLNMYAAVDIAEMKFRQQLQKYKDQHGSGRSKRQLFARMTRQGAFL